MDHMVNPGILALQLIGLAILVLIPTVFWVWALIDCLNNETGDDRLVWVLVVMLLHAFGALIYVIVRRPKRPRQSGPTQGNQTVS